MNIEAFLLCDAATDQQGKLNVLGAFDNIFAKQLPAVHPACAVAARIRFETIESGNHTVRIHVIDEDGHSTGPKMEGNIAVHVGDDADSAVVNLILNVQGQKFEKYGKYRIDLAIDGNIQASLPLRVSEAPNQA
jgi:hypothetical protein